MLEKNLLNIKKYWTKKFLTNGFKKKEKNKLN